MYNVLTIIIIIILWENENIVINISFPLIFILFYFLTCTET